MQKVGDVLRLRRTCISGSMSGSRYFHITLLIVRPTADITEISVLCWLYVESSKVGALLAPAIARNN